MSMEEVFVASIGSDGQYASSDGDAVLLCDVVVAFIQPKDAQTVLGAVWKLLPLPVRVRHEQVVVVGVCVCVLTKCWASLLYSFDT